MRFPLLAIAILLSGCASAPPAPEAATNVIFFLGAGKPTDPSLVFAPLPNPQPGAMSTYMTGAPCSSQPAASLAEQARARGRAIGLVTNTSVTDAAPAAVYAHACDSAMQNDIAAALVPGGAGYNAALGANGLDVVFGGGTRAFLPAALDGTRSDGRDLLRELRQRGVRVLTDTTQLNRLVAQVNLPVMGLFAPGELDYDAERDATRQPGLAEMTRAAIDVLAQRPNGFFLVVDGGLTERALRAQRPDRALQESVAFDGAVKGAIAQMQRLDPGLQHTLIVVVAQREAYVGAIGAGAAALRGPVDSARIHQLMR